MHTFKTDNIRIHHNSDMSGMVIVMRIDSGQSIEVQGEDLIEFVAGWARRQKIGKLEELSANEVLGVDL